MPIPASPLSRANLSRTLERGLRTVVFQAYENRVHEWEQIYNRLGSEKAAETDVTFAGLGLLGLKAEGQSADLDSGTESYPRVYTHLTYALRYMITREAREDDLYGPVMRMGSELGNAAVYTQEIQAMGPFNNSAATQYTAGGTGYPLLSTTHFRQDDGTWSNKLSSGADLSNESLDTLLTQVRTGTLDHRGHKKMIRPKYLMVGPSDQRLAQRIIRSSQIQGSNDNDVNPFKDDQLEVITMTHMTDDGRWYLVADKGDTTLNWFDRRKISSDQDSDPAGTQNVWHMVSYRASNGITAAQGIWGSL